MGMWWVGLGELETRENCVYPSQNAQYVTANCIIIMQVIVCLLNKEKLCVPHKCIY